MPVRIITDSACDMSGSEHPALTVIPISVMFGDTVYQDGVDLSHEQFYDLLTSSDGLPGTGQINPFIYAKVYEMAAEAGEELVVITLSSKLSGTYQNAVVAAGDAPGEVHVVDSLNATVGMRVLVDYALRLVDEGRTAAQVASALEAARDRVELFALLDTLEYLRRGGRISNAAGAVGEMLNIKPLVTVEEGAVCPIGRARGLKSGRKQMTKLVEAKGIDPSMPIAFGYSGNDPACLQKYLDENAGLLEPLAGSISPILSVGATIGTHVGPGGIAMAFFRPV